ncbi:MAG: 2-oxoglutarate dehydrogenase complex dihydrolipoyllysine-residue succinyltransferase [bacterium]
MTTPINTPALPESVNDATVATWHRQVGEYVSRDENLVDLETDKVVLEVPAPVSGILTKIISPEGAVVKADDALAIIDEGATATTNVLASVTPHASPSVRKKLHEKGLDESDVIPSSAKGHVTVEDVEKFAVAKPSTPKDGPGASSFPSTNARERMEKRVPMTRLRARIAERLVEAQRNAAILTTFNEVDMQPVMDLRASYRETFERKHGIKLGFMSFFVKATCDALKKFPSVNASIEDNEVVYHGFYNIGVAISSERGLVVPVITDAEQRSFADIERAIVDFSHRAKDGKLNLDDLSGGTFSVSNGGVFGSLMSTPILNPPQSGILGMHKIQKRPVVVNDQIVIRPMMYLALTYDHRLIDGREAVQFLVHIKELIEDPARLLLDV